jgi:hypothetical protein
MFCEYEANYVTVPTDGRNRIVVYVSCVLSAVTFALLVYLFSPVLDIT